MQMTSKTRMAAVAVVAAVLSACGGSSGGGGSASSRIGPSGGTVSTGAVSLRVSPGALSTEMQITVSDVPGADGKRRIEIEPGGVALAVPSTLSVKSDDGNASDERLVSIDDSSGSEVEHSMAGEAENETEHAREVEIEHTGTFEDRPAHACTPACDAGMECDDGVCKPHGGGGGGNGSGGADDPPNHG